MIYISDEAQARVVIVNCKCTYDRHEYGYNIFPSDIRAAVLFCVAYGITFTYKR